MEFALPAAYGVEKEPRTLRGALRQAECQPVPFPVIGELRPADDREFPQREDVIDGERMFDGSSPGAKSGVTDRL
tara:strand:- start:3685 stop:3909 length:225 start_codon:yes stop_codon:yes gene_type:complete